MDGVPQAGPDGDSRSSVGGAYPASAGSALDLRLTGRLPCVFCGYDLQGLSIRGQCPECGSAVRATILHRVDPRAAEFSPILGRRRVAAGLLMWPAGGLVIALSAWLQRVLELARSEWGLSIEVPWLWAASLGGVALAGAGALGMLRPTRDTPPWRSAVGLLGVAAAAPMAWAVWRIGVIDRADWRPYSGSEPDAARAAARLVFGAAVVAMCLAIRPLGRELVRRSMALRTGRVDRQAILLVAIAAGVAMVGDTMRLAGCRGGGWDLCTTIGTPIVAIGSMLVTVGVVGALIDAARIAGVVLQPPPALGDVVGPPTG